jgi:hypothetical protein
MKLKLKNPEPAAISWIVTVLMLCVITIYTVIKTGSFGISGITFFVSMIAYFLSYLILKNK